MTIEQIREELVTVDNDIQQMANSTTEWNTETFDSLEANKLKLDKQLGALLKTKAAAASQEVVTIDPVQSVPAAIVAEPVHVYTAEQHGATPAWTEDPKFGYKGEFVAGQIIKDHINCSLKGPEAASTEYGQYSAFINNMEMTSGVTSTLTNGIEILPQLLPDTKIQAGARLAGLEMMEMQSTAQVGIIEYYRDEKTYQTDGLIAAWTSEGAQLSATRDAINKGQLQINPLYVFAALTEEIMNDAPRLESRYIMKAPETMQVELWIKILAGNGVGQPLGIKDGGSTISVARTTASRVKYEDLVNMEARFLAAGSTAGFYVCNQVVLPQLMQIQDVAGAYLWKAETTDGITGGIAGRIFGRPVIISEDAEALNVAGDITLVDPRGYLLMQQSRGVSFATSPHFYFDTRKTALRFDTRVGGQPYFKTAYTPRKGGSTLSNFVNIAAG